MNLPEDFVAAVRASAEIGYCRDNLYCSEAVLKAALEHTKRLDAHGRLLALASAFPKGMGGAGCSCGAVTGGMLALGVFFGRTDAEDEGIDRCMALGKELHDVFKARHKAVCCRVLNKNVRDGSEEQLRQCCVRVGDAAEALAHILTREWDSVSDVFPDTE